MQSNHVEPKWVHLNQRFTELWLPRHVWKSLGRAARDRKITLDQLSSWALQVHGRSGTSIEATLRHFSVLVENDPRTAFFRPMPPNTSIVCIQNKADWNVLSPRDFLLNRAIPSFRGVAANRA